MWMWCGWQLLGGRGVGSLNRSTNIQTCTAGVWLLITGFTSSSYQCLGPMVVCTKLLSQFNQLSVFAAPSLCNNIYYLSLCVYVCVWREGQRANEGGYMKGIPRAEWGIKVADDSSDPSLSIFIRKLKAINSYLTAEPLVHLLNPPVSLLSL